MSSVSTDTITLTGAEIIVKTLKNLGVDTIFGYPGGIVLSIYDELFKQHDIKHYLVRHEQSAVHAAEGYARVSGKCGVVLVTSGPGAANTVSGIANAYLDGYPVVVLTGQVFSSLLGKDAFQEVDIIDITKSCTKANFQVRDVNKLESTLVNAFLTALSGKQGPVVVDLVKDIFTQNAEFKPNFVVNNLEYTGTDKEDIKQVLRELCNAEKPVIVAGGGVVTSNAAKELTAFARMLNIPVVNTMMGLGTYPYDDKNYAGMIGIFGTRAANKTVRESSLVFSVGARFNDRVTCCFNNNELSRKFIQLDINEKEISRIIPAHLALIGDAGKILAELTDEFKNDEFKFDNLSREKWCSEVREYVSQNPKPVKRSNLLHSFEVIQHIYEYCKSFNPVVSTEVGQHQMWTAQNYKFSAPRKFLTSGGSGTMGFGLPAAIGASIALNKEPVICISGDGSFQMNSHEMATCVDYNLPVKIFILNNGYLGMVRQLQQKFCEGRYSQTKISNPDFVKLAQSYGILGLRVNQVSEINRVLDEVFNTNGPVVVDFVVEPEEVV